jgi:hypothetical protein
MPAPRTPPPLALALIALLWTATPTARGADLHTFLGADDRGVRARVVLADLRVADPGFADDRFEVGAAWHRGLASAAVGWRRTALAGPAGNLVLEVVAGGGRSAAGGARTGVEVGARGVAGPVALGVRLGYGQRTPHAWPELAVEPPPAPAADPRARTGADADGSVATAALSAAWRIDRAWTLSVAPSVARTGRGWTGAVDASLRRFGIADALDLSVRIDAASGAVARHAALGATLHHVPRRAPESRATVWIGSGGASVALGGEVAWFVRDGATEAALAAGWAPFWSDRPAGYAALRASAPMREGRGRVGVAWTGSALVAELGWSRPLPR